MVLRGSRDRSGNRQTSSSMTARPSRQRQSRIVHLSPEGIAMEPRPVVLGLTLCDYVIVEERTKKVSLIGTFTGLGVPDFPAQASPFSVFTVLTDGLGSATIELLVTHMETNAEVRSPWATLVLPDQVTELMYQL